MRFSWFSSIDRIKWYYWYVFPWRKLGAATDRQQRPNAWNFLIEENQDAFQAFANLFILGFLLEEHLDLVVHGTARDRMVKEIVSNRKLKSAKA